MPTIPTNPNQHSSSVAGLLNQLRSPRNSLLVALTLTILIGLYGLTGWFASQIIALFALSPLLLAYYRRASRQEAVSQRLRQQLLEQQQILEATTQQLTLLKQSPLSTTEAIAVIDKDGHIFQTSEKMRWLTGYRSQPGVKAGVDTIITNTEFQAALAQVLDGETGALDLTCGLHDNSGPLAMQINAINHGDRTLGAHLHIWANQPYDYWYRNSPLPRPMSTASLLKTMRHLLPAAIPAPAHPDINPVAVKCRTDSAYASSIYPSNSTMSTEPDTGETLYMLIRLLKPENVIEVGGHVGAATIVMAQALEDNQQGMLYTVDLEDEHRLLIERHVAEAGLTHRVQVYQSDSVEAVTRHKLPPGEVIFIDGDHSYDGAKRDFEAYIPLLAQNGVMIYHDTIKIMALRRLMGEIAGNPACKLHTA